MHFVLDLVYLIALLIAAPWLAWQAARSGKYRAGWKEKLFGLVPNRSGNRPCVWFHAVSVGEVLLLRRVVKQLHLCRPDIEVCISTTTNTGMEVARQQFPELMLFYFPLDFSWAVACALARIRPHIVALAELELWPNFIHAARRTGARVVVVNGRMSPKSAAGYRRIRPLIRPTLRRVDQFLIQTQEYAERFAQAGAPMDRLTVTGSVKYDGVETERGNAASERLRELFNITRDEIVWVAGSTSDPEEQIVLDAYEQLHQDIPALRLILVPRHKERFDEVAERIAARRLPLVRRSRLAPGTASESPHRGAANPRPVVLVDTLGELSSVWGLADVAFVGGSFAPRGGQNMIEPAGYGSAVLFGPGVWNFQDTVNHLLGCGGAIQVLRPDALAPAIRDLALDPTRRRELGRNAQQFVLRQQGATQRTIEQLVARLPAAPLPIASAA